MTLLFGDLCHLLLYLVLLLLEDDVFVADVGLRLLLESHHLLLVRGLLVLQLLDVLVSFLHLILAILYFLLHLVVLSLQCFVIFSCLV